MTPRPSLRRTTSAAALAALLGAVPVAFVPAAATPRSPAAAPSAASAGGAGARAAVDDGWDVVDPASVGMDQATMFPAKAYAFQEDRHTQGVVVVRAGKLVAEWYAPGEGPQSWAASWSMGKSFTSALIGIAIAEGKIQSVDQSMATWFPDWAGTPKAAITLRDVLHMESGLKWNESYNPANVADSDIIQMGITPHELDYAAARPAQVAPGTRFNYSSGETLLMSHVIEVATGMPADEYARQKLFDPIGISQVEWWRDGDGHTLTYCCLDTTSRNYARMGLLYLRGGNWGGTQVVPSSWVQDSWSPAKSYDGYGYQWWLETIDGVPGTVYMMNGHDGQFTYVIPSLDLVVVRNGDYVKSECDPVADPTLFGPYPPSGLAPGRGTTPPASWDHAAFLAPIVASITGASPGGTAVPAPETPSASRFTAGEATDPCAATPPPTTTTVPPTTTPAGRPSTRPSRPATPVPGRPTFTG